MESSEILVNVLFYVFAFVAVAGAVGVAASRNIVRSAFALLAVLFAAAALYALMRADFIAAAQVLIYVGGILVLIIFAVMLTHRITDVALSNESTPGPAAFCAVLCLLFALVVIILPVPEPAHNKWDAVRKSEEIRAGDVGLLQYQPDGTTGLARGGTAIGDAVVVGVKAPSPLKDVVRVNVEASDQTSGWEKPVTASAPVAPGEVTLVRLSNLKEGKYRWRLSLDSGKGEPQWLSGSEFQVHKGVTEPIAMALAGPYLFAFEAVSVLLLAALVGAAFLARKEVRE